MTSPFDPLHHPHQMAELIAGITGESHPRVLERLEREFREPGISVGEDFRRRGLKPHTWGEDMIRFYEETDGFLYELAIWNCNRIKIGMRRFIRHALHPIPKQYGPPIDVLFIGDGLGFDCLEIARTGHRVTYFEVPGRTQRFAEAMFQRSGADIPMITDPQAIPADAFDAVVCLDVLEHVPDPVEMVGHLARPLRPSGLLIAHAPFYMITPRHLTHLKSNRRFSGDLSLYRRHGFELVDAAPWWNPLVLSREPRHAKLWPGATRRRLKARLMGAFLRLGRLCSWPFRAGLTYQSRCNQWFGQASPDAESPPSSESN